MSLLRITLGLILSVDIRFHDTSSWTGVVRGGFPRSAREFYPPQFLENNAMPVLRRTNRPQTALALAATLITQDAKLPQPIAAKPMRTKQPREIFVDGADRLLIRYCRPNQPVHVLHRLDFCLDDVHPIFTIPLAAVSPWLTTLYNTVVLENGGVELSADDAIAELNARLDQHHLGFQFTGGELMRRDSQLIHKEVTETVVQLLAAAGFEGPNEEFLRAHKAYLSGNIKEAVREALNAFESTLKAIFVQRKWKFDPQKDTASKLLSIAFDQGLVPNYLQTEFTALRTTLEAGVPTLRNRTAGHGQGPDPVEIPKHLAAYALHLTGSSIVFLVAAHEKLK